MNNTPKTGNGTIIKVVSLIVSLLFIVIGGVAFSFQTFATKDEVSHAETRQMSQIKELKSDINGRLDKIEGLLWKVVNQ